MAILPFKRVYQYSNRNLYQLARSLTPILEALGFGGGGGASIIEVSAENVQSLVLSNGLTPGATYKITGFNKVMPAGSPSNPNGYLPEVLYNDMTDSGSTIYMEALSTSELANSGYGEFYNPKYYDGDSYDNTDGTGLYGIWDGENPDPSQVPEYVENQVVFWGGYAWKNLNGNVGYNVNPYVLNNDDWEIIPFSNSTWYEKVVDEIKVDWINGVITERYNAANQILVSWNPQEYSWWMGLDYTNPSINPIANIGWGNYSKITPQGIDYDFYGMARITSINTALETVNFKGLGLVDIDANEGYMTENYIGKNVYLSDLSLRIGSGFNDNTIYGNNSRNTNIYNIELTISAYINSNFFGPGTQINNLKASTYSYISYNHLIDGCYITNNNLFNSYLSQNNLSVGGINNNTLSFSTISQNDVLNGSYITGNNLSGSQIYSNSMQNTSITFNTLTSTSNIDYNAMISSSITYNTLSNNSTISNVTATQSNIGSNLFVSGSYFGGSSLTAINLSFNTFTNEGRLSNCLYPSTKTLSYATFDSVQVNGIDLTTANNIFLSCPKRIYKRNDGTQRLSYYDNSDTITITNVNA